MALLSCRWCASIVAAELHLGSDSGEYFSSLLAHLHIPELLLEHPERMLHLGSDSGLDLLDLLQQRLHRVLFVQLLTLGVLHGNCQLTRALASGRLCTPW